MYILFHVMTMFYRSCLVNNNNPIEGGYLGRLEAKKRERDLYIFYTIQKGMNNNFKMNKEKIIIIQSLHELITCRK